jgi:hypothetical protein
MATIASLLRERVSLQVNSVDRTFLAGYVPKLQSEGMVVRFLLDRGFPIPSPAALGKISQSYARAIERFAAKQKIPVVRFKRGESKAQTARRYMQQAERDGRFGVVMIGVAQEKAFSLAGVRERRDGRAPALLLSADVGVPQPLLLLRPRPGVGPGVHQDRRRWRIPSEYPFTRRCAASPSSTKRSTSSARESETSTARPSILR